MTNRRIAVAVLAVLGAAACDAGTRATGPALEGAPALDQGTTGGDGGGWMGSGGRETPADSVPSTGEGGGWMGSGGSRPPADSVPLAP